jgi:hypothetical protein
VTVPTLLVVSEHDDDARVSNETLLARLGGARRLGAPLLNEFPSPGSWRILETLGPVRA